ncbi:MAG TPA: NAD(P)H-dependent oxidoreductase [Phaeodactylibacter sp.]|nr:NAD(P)H-dependent oxidoreductase [Phaeodactylibacter sp.]
MITVISGSNRKHSECLRFADHYYQLLKELAPGETVKLLSLEQIPHDWFHPDMYTQQSDSLRRIQDEYILPAQKLVFVSPEYNGSIPGAVKLFIDGCTVREYSQNFQDKKVALVGISSGRAGNLRGMEHLTGILNYLGAVIMPDKLPISSISKLKNGNGEITDEDTLNVMKKHAAAFLKF